MKVDAPMDALALYNEAYWEQEMATRGYDARVQSEENAGGLSMAAMAMKKRLFDRLLPFVVAHRDALVLPAGKAPGEAETQHPFIIATPEAVAATILNWLVSYPHADTDDFRSRKDIAIGRQGRRLGTMLMEAAAFDLHLRNAETQARFKALLKRSDKAKSAKWALQKMLRDWRNENDNTTCVKVGVEAIGMVLKALPEYVERSTHFYDGKTTITVQKTEAWWEVYRGLIDKHAIASPMLLPMIIPPKPWAPKKVGGEVTQGGYYYLSRPLVRNSDKMAGKGRISERSMAALNVAQATEWQINPIVHKTALKALSQGILLPCIPTLPVDHTPKEMGKYSEFNRTLSAADDVAHTSFFFPKSYDWRHRMYDLPNDLRPQGSGFSKGLLRFKKGLKLTDTGGYWLAVHVANLWGLDKKPLAERVKWTHDNTEKLGRIAREPLIHLDWTDLKKNSWLALAGAEEWTRYANGGGLSYIPVSLDGSCSGMQHFSCLTRDSKGAHATNCRNHGDPQDLYLSVLERVQARVSYDFGQGDANAILWCDKIMNPAEGRDVCKRATMTVPYGVTDRGITQFMISDNHVDSFPKEAQFKAARYMTTLIRAAIDDTMRSARGVQQYINEAAFALAKAGKPLAWETPMGSIVEQNYRVMKERRIRTPLGRLVMRTRSVDDPLDARRARMATSPNVIHSLDGSHLQAVVLQMAANGVPDVALVHDSFGTHAENTGLMRDILRQELYAIYKDNQIERWKESVEAISGEKLPPAPSVGDWDVGEVLGADYLFA